MQLLISNFRCELMLTRLDLNCQWGKTDSKSQTVEISSLLHHFIYLPFALFHRIFDNCGCLTLHTKHSPNFLFSFFDSLFQYFRCTRSVFDCWYSLQLSHINVFILNSFVLVTLLFKLISFLESEKTVFYYLGHNVSMWGVGSSELNLYLCIWLFFCWMDPAQWTCRIAKWV